MNIDRLEFLKKTALVTGAGVVAATGISKIGGLSAQAGPLTPALTPDGKLVQVRAGQEQDFQVPPSNQAVRDGIAGRKWVMAIDLAKCDGCKKCTVACQKMHYCPSDREWIKVFSMQDAPATASYFFPKPCFHCDDPPCTKVCPVGATFKRQDGIVLVDNSRCIGCRFCLAACPYSSRFFNWGKLEEPPEEQSKPYSPEWGYPHRVGTAEKCDFCPDMAAQGKLPHCASGCPMGAIYYGDQNENAVTNSDGETLEFSKLMKDRAGYRYMEDLGTEPRVYYLPPKNRMYPGPDEKGEGA